MRLMIAAVLLLGGCATDFGVAPTGPWTDFFNEPRTEAVPKDVRVFVIKSQGCGHFSGEVGDDNDSARGRYLAKQTDELCGGISEQRAKLLKKYSGDAAVAGIIADVWDDYGFE